MLALVIGTGRSGTTLVQETLSRHPATGFVSGLDDKLSRLNLTGRWNGRLYRRTPPRDPRMRALAESTRVLERGRLRVAPSEAYGLLDRHVFSGFSTPCRDLLAEDLTPYLERRVRDFFTARIEAQGCDVFVQHLTGWPRTGFLHAALPDLKAVNVIRDGRAVASSWLQMGWWDGWRGPDNWIFGPLPASLQEEWEDSGRSFAVLAALGWKMLMAAYEDARALMPPAQWLDVRYEDILASPREQVARMLEFLELPWDAEFERGFARHEIKGGRRAAYRDELTPAQLTAVDKVLAEPLARWGYDPA
jgi:sulfotransferase family protein